MSALLNRADADLVARILAIDISTDTGRRSAARLNRMLERMRDLNAQLRERVRGRMADEAVEIASYEVDFQARLLAESAPMVDFEMVSASQVRAAALSTPFRSVHLRWATVGEHVDEAFRQRLRRAEAEIRIGFVEGDGIGAMVRRLRGTQAAGFKDGILAMSRRDIETIARTATNHVATRAKQVLLEENARLVRGVRWLAILDGRTCFVAGTLVETSAGKRPIEMIRTGEAVIGGSGAERRVSGTKTAATKRLAKVTLSNGEVLYCTPDHLFLTERQEWKEARDLSSGETLAERLK